MFNGAFDFAKTTINSVAAAAFSYIPSASEALKWGVGVLSWQVSLGLSFKDAGGKPHLRGALTGMPAPFSLADSSSGLDGFEYVEPAFKHVGVEIASESHPITMVSRSLTTAYLNCDTATGDQTYLIYYPTGGSYTEGQPLNISFSVYSNNFYTGNYKLNGTFFFTLQTPGAGTLSYGALVGEVIPITLDLAPLGKTSSTSLLYNPTYTVDSHFNGALTLSIIPSVACYDPLLNNKVFTYFGTNVKDALSVYNPLPKLSASVKGSASFPVTTAYYHNYDNVQALISLLSGPAFVTYNNITGVVTSLPDYGDYGDYTYQLLIQDKANASNRVILVGDAPVDNSAPAAVAGSSVFFLSNGEPYNGTFGFTDANGILDITGLSFVGVRSGSGSIPVRANGIPLDMNVTQVGVNLWSVAYNTSKASFPSIQVYATATDHAGATGTAVYSFQVSSSLRYTLLSGTVSGIENVLLLLPNYGITTISTLPITLTYKLDDPTIGALSCNTSGLVISYNSNTGTLILAGPLTLTNVATVYYAPKAYVSGPFGYTTKFDDGLTPTPPTEHIDGSVAFVYTPLVAGAAIANTTVSIGATATVIAPPVVINHHGVAVVYSAKLSTGAALPTWMSFDTSTGAVTPNPTAGNQGAYSVVVSVQEADLLHPAVDLPAYTMVVAEHAPTVAIPPSIAAPAKYGELFSYTLPSGTFVDAEGPADIVNITASGLVGNMQFNATTGGLTWMPQASDPSPVFVRFMATDTQGAAVTATLSIPINPSLVFTNPVSAQTLIENTGANTAQAIALPALVSGSAGNVTLTYQLSDSVAKLNLNVPVGVIVVGNSTSLVTVTGSVSQINQITGTVVSAKYSRSSLVLSVSGTNGAQPVASQTSYTLGVTPVFVPLSVNPGISIFNASAIIGQTNLGISIPSTMIDNPHGATLIYSASVSLNGTALASVPAWMGFDPATGGFLPNPVTGAQGLYSVVVTAQDASLSSNQVALPAFTLNVPNHAPTVANTLSVGTPVRYGELLSFTLPADTFADADGALDVVSITATGLVGDMQFNGDVLTWTPQASDPSSVTLNFIATDSQGKSVKAALTLTPAASVSFTAPAASQTIIENTGSDAAQAVSLPVVATGFVGNISVIYQLSDTNAKLMLSSVAGVSVVGNNTATVTVIGPVDKVNLLTAGIIPSRYSRSNLVLSVSGNNGAQPLASQVVYGVGVSSRSASLLLNPAVRVFDASASIGQTNSVITVPSSAIVNPHGKPLTYSARLLDGSPLPPWMGFDASSCTFSPAPVPGCQKDYSIIVTFTDSTGEDGSVDLRAFTLTVPENLPLVQAGYSSSVLAPRGAPLTYSSAGIFTAPDRDIANITFSGLSSGMSVVNGTLTWLPGSGNQYSINVVATTLLGKQVIAPVTFTIVSSLSVTPPAVTQTCLENSDYCDLVLPTMASPSVGAATIEVQLTDQTKGAIVLNPSAVGVTFTVVNGVPTLRGALADIQRPGVLRFVPASNTFGTAQVSFTVVDDGVGNSASTPTFFSISTSKIYIPPVAGNPAEPVSGQPSQSLGVTFPAILNANNDPLTYRAQIFNSTGALLVDSVDAVNPWNMTINPAFKQARFVIPSDMHPGVYNVKLITGTTAGPITAETTTTLTVTGTLVTTNVNSVASINIDTAVGGQGVISLFNVNYAGDGLISMTLRMPAAAGHFGVNSYLGYTPTLSTQGTDVVWSLSAPKEIMNWFLANFDVRLKPSASGQILISGVMDTGVERMTTPSVSLVPVIQVVAPVIPEPSFADTSGGKVTASVLGVVGSLLLTAFVAYARGKWARFKEAAQLRKMVAVTAILKSLHDEFIASYPIPYEGVEYSNVFHLDVFSRFLAEVINYDNEGVADARAFGRLDLFRSLSTGFIYHNASRDEPVVVKDRWVLLDLVISKLSNLKSSMQASKPNFDFIAYRLRLIRTLLDMVLLDDTFSKRRISVVQKLVIIELIRNLQEAKDILNINLDLRTAEGEKLYNNRKRIKFELKALLAGVTFLLDDDTLFKRIGRRRGSVPPAKLWYLKVFMVERLIAYAISAQDKSTRLHQIRTAKEVIRRADRAITYKTIEPLDMMIGYYRERKPQWHVVYAANRSLYKLLQACNTIIAASPQPENYPTVLFIRNKLNDVLGIGKPIVKVSRVPSGGRRFLPGVSRRQRAVDSRVIVAVSEGAAVSTPLRVAIGKPALLSSRAPGVEGSSASAAALTYTSNPLNGSSARIAVSHRVKRDLTTSRHDSSDDDSYSSSSSGASPGYVDSVGGDDDRGLDAVEPETARLSSLAMRDVTLDAGAAALAPVTARRVSGRALD